jgi:hypothetical protein
MNLKDFLAIAGHPGLFRYLSQAKNGIIVESLIDKKRMPAYASEKVSTLEDIAIFTSSEEVPLKEIFRKIYEKESGGQAIDSKSDPKLLFQYFETILPEFDRKRVYASDIKKLISWYNLLQSLDLLNLPEEEAPTGENNADSVKEPKTESVKKPAKPKSKNKPKTESAG